MKALWNGKVLAEAERDDLIYIEGNWYFPPGKVKTEFLIKSETPYTCPWKGECQYFDIKADGSVSKDDAWCYPHPKDSAIEIVKKSSGKDFSGYIAFWRSVSLEQ